MATNTQTQERSQMQDGSMAKEMHDMKDTAMVAGTGAGSAVTSWGIGASQGAEAGMAAGGAVGAATGGVTGWGVGITQGMILGLVTGMFLATAISASRRV